MKIGIDIEEYKRFEKMAASDSKLKRIFSDVEIEYCKSKKIPAAHFAARFAAKEAVWKALSKKVPITEITIKNTASGKPEVYIKNKKAAGIDVSLSHAKNYVVAAAIKVK
jgi:holo-[acyl-carrier protein] synthase